MASYPIIYRIYCNDENTFVPTSATTTPPTTCPNNALHSVNPNSVDVLDDNPPSAANTILVSDPSAPNGQFYFKDFADYLNDIIGGGTQVQATEIQGNPISTTSPTIGTSMQWDGTEWAPAIPSIFGAYYDRVTEIQLNNSTFTALPWDVVNITGSTFSHTAGTSDITINKKAMYSIVCPVSFRSNNNTRTNSNARLARDTGSGFNEIPGSLVYGYHRNGSQGYNSITCQATMALDKDDIIRAEAVIISGGSDRIYFSAGGCNIKIEKLYDIA